MSVMETGTASTTTSAGLIATLATLATGQATLAPLATGLATTTQATTGQATTSLAPAVGGPGSGRPWKRRVPISPTVSFSKTL